VNDRVPRAFRVLVAHRALTLHSP